MKRDDTDREVPHHYKVAQERVKGILALTAALPRLELRTSLELRMSREADRAEAPRRARCPPPRKRGEQGGQLREGSAGRGGQGRLP